jgi:hypothetical protein
VSIIVSSITQRSICSAASTHFAHHFIFLNLDKSSTVSIALIHFANLGILDIIVHSPNHKIRDGINVTVHRGSSTRKLSTISENL